MTGTTVELVKKGMLKVGSKVEVIESYWETMNDIAIGKNIVATVKIIKHEYYDDNIYIGLEFENHCDNFHDCEGNTVYGYGYFIGKNDVVKIMEVNKKGW